MPWPLTPADRAAGYTHRLAFNQFEVSLTQVFDRPVQGRHFFEAVIRENLDLGRPDRVGLLFPLRMTRTTPRRPTAIARASSPTACSRSLHVEYKHSHVKQYFKEQRALRTEMTINNPQGLLRRQGGRQSSVPARPRPAGRSQPRSRAPQSPLRAHAGRPRPPATPTTEDGQRVSALRFGDPRVMAVFQAITGFTHLPRGFRNRDLRPQVEALLGRPYSTAQMTYDLRRLHLKGLIHRIPKTHRYTVNSYGLKVAFFYAKLYLRILRPNCAALLPDDGQLPRTPRVVLDQLDREIAKLHEQAALAA